MQLIQWIEFGLSAVTAGAIVFAVVQIRINRRQLYLATMDRCITSFRSINLTDSKLADWRHYIDLCNEELFYMEQNYLPEAVGLEWIDGMLDFVPVYDKDGTVWNEAWLPKTMVAGYSEIVASYPRVKYAFTLDQPSDPHTIYGNGTPNERYQHKERLALCKQILKNVRLYRVR